MLCSGTTFLITCVVTLEVDTTPLWTLQIDPKSSHRMFFYKLAPKLKTFPRAMMCSCPRRCPQQPHSERSSEGAGAGAEGAKGYRAGWRGFWGSLPRLPAVGSWGIQMLIYLGSLSEISLGLKMYKPYGQRHFIKQKFTLLTSRNVPSNT